MMEENREEYHHWHTLQDPRREFKAEISVIFFA
jgi:hypothetical protein